MFKRFMIFALCAALLFTATPSVGAVDGVYEFSAEYKSSVFYKRLLEVELTGDNRYDVLAVALSQLGYHEGDSDADMHGYSNGDKNFVEYNRYRRPLDNNEGNGASYGYAWCASFVVWCNRHAGVEATASGSEIGCDSMISWYTRNKRYHPKDEGYIPLPGDAIMFGEDSDSDHVGLVLGVEGDTVYTIEGNAGGVVGIHSYDYDDDSILGFCVPKYTTVEGTDYKPLLDNNKETLGDYIVTAEVLNLRAQPHKDAELLTTLQAGEKVTVTEADGDWGKVTVGGKTGWINLNYAKATKYYFCYVKLDLQRGDGGTLWGQYGDTLTLPREAPKKDGKQFLGWTDKALSDEIKYAPGDSIVPEGNTTLYAVWETKYKVEFYDEDFETLLDTQYCDHGEVPTPTKAPEKEGKSFTGWTPDPNRPTVKDMKYYATYSGGEKDESVDTPTKTEPKEKLDGTEITVIVCSFMAILIAALLIVLGIKKKKE